MMDPDYAWGRIEYHFSDSVFSVHIQPGLTGLRYPFNVGLPHCSGKAVATVNGNSHCNNERIRYRMVTLTGPVALTTISGFQVITGSL